MLLGRCEFGKDDYSLNIENLPWPADQETQADSPTETESKGVRAKKPAPANQRGLFDPENE
ncbi:MAG TPA: hypothetical protein DCP63_04740 [Bacteroidetes bacterium]|nr:hypothetical protein [Bacteroidota bacterium]